MLQRRQGMRLQILLGSIQSPVRIGAGKFRVLPQGASSASSRLFTSVRFIMPRSTAVAMATVTVSLTDALHVLDLVSSVRLPRPRVWTG